MGSALVGVQCPSLCTIGELLDYQDWFWNPGLSPVLVSIAFPFAFHILVIFHLLFLHLPLKFIRVSSLQLMYLQPIRQPFTYSLLSVSSKLWTCSGTRFCGPRGGAGVRMHQKSRFKFLSWPGFEPRTLQSNGRERYH